MLKLLSVLCSLLILFTSQLKALEIQGELGAEAIVFVDKAQYASQQQQYISGFMQPEIFKALNDQQDLNIKLFYRYDPQSNSRTHADIREFMLNSYADNWQLHLGVGKVFWGKTESRNLVDVINQVDNIEFLDTEARLGQPMAHAKFIKDWGIVDLFVLPYFRQAKFLAKDARPIIHPNIDTNLAIFQSSDKQRNIDIAARWSQSFIDLDLAISAFVGTQRTPLMQPVMAAGTVKLIPVYVQTKQLGIEALYIYQDYLFKAEILARDSHDVNFNKKQTLAAVIGLEYTIVGIFNTRSDLGIIAEYMYDEWQEITPFQNDFMSGIRLAINDAQSTELLIGNITDLDDGTQFWTLEGSRRIGDNWQAEILARAVANVHNNNTLVNFKQDNLLALRLTYYF